MQTSHYLQIETISFTFIYPTLDRSFGFRLFFFDRLWRLFSTVRFPTHSILNSWIFNAIFQYRNELAVRCRYDNVLSLDSEFDRPFGSLAVLSDRTNSSPSAVNDLIGMVANIADQAFKLITVVRAAGIESPFLKMTTQLSAKRFCVLDVDFWNILVFANNNTRRRAFLAGGTISILDNTSTRASNDAYGP